MSFRKPFNAVPVKLRLHYLAKQRRERRLGVAKVLATAAVLGALAGTLSALPAGAISGLNPIGAPALGGTVRPKAASDRADHVYYSRCAEARAAGAAPIYAGEPGYRASLDGDGDGIACEPYRGR